MKRSILGIIMCCLLGFGLQAQKVIDTWAFSTGVDISLWMDLGGQDSTILVGNDIISGRSGLIDIGFPFQFGESTHTKFSTNVNGTIRLGNTQIPASGNINNPLGSDMSNGPKVEPFGMQGRFYSDCYTTTALLGDSGNRVRVIETRMSGRYWDASGNVSFQVQLFETGGLRIVYGETNNYNAGFTGSGTQVGLATTTGSPSYNKDVIFIDMVAHQEVRFEGNCTRRNPDGVWVNEGRWYMLAPDSNVCPYPPSINTTSTNPASITLTNSYGGAADLHIMIPLAGLDTLWPRTLNYFTLNNVFNPVTTYTGSVQSVCDSGRTSYRTRSFTFTTSYGGEVRHLPWTCTFQNSNVEYCWDVSHQTTSANRWKWLSNAMRCGNTIEQSYDEWLISPVINLPAEEGIVLQWNYRATALSGVSPQVQVRVALCDSLGTVDSTAWTTLLTLDTVYSYYSQNQLLLDDLGGQRVKVAFVRIGTGGQYAYVDDVELFLDQIPVIELEAPELAFVGDSAVFSCNVVDGIANGLLWEWHSSLTNNWGYDSSQWIVGYYNEGGGLDTVTVIVSNAYGADTASAIIRVVDCSTTIPWEEDFASGNSGFQNDCWIVDGWSRRSRISLLDERDVATYYPHPMLSNTVGKYMLTPAFDIPTTNVDNLKFWVQCAADDLLVCLSPTGDTAVASFTDTLMVIHGDRQHMRWFLADLSPYAGQTVRMGIFRMTGNQPLVNAVKVDYDLVPVLGRIEGSDVVFTGDTMTYHTTPLRGATPIVFYPWSSTLNAQGGTQYMTTSSDGGTVTIAYAVGGYDTLTAIAYNNYGEDTVTKIVHVVDCQPVTSLPWTEDFGDSRLCWRVPYGSQWGYGSANGINYLQNSPDVNLSDSWLISPAINIPADPNECVRFFWKVARNYNTAPHHYQVLVSDDFDYTNTANYTVLYTDTAVHAAFPDYDYLSVPLTAYAGQTIHLAFHHLSANNSTSHIMFLIGAEVRSANVPRIRHIEAPADHYTEDGNLQATALLSEGSPLGLFYSWHSSLLDSTIYSVDSTVAISYSVGGIDTLTLFAANAYGADTAYVVVNVHHCPAIAVPFREPFKSASTLGCWRMWNFTTGSDLSGWRIGGAYGNDLYPVMMAGTYYTTAHAWLLSPTIDIPTSADGLNLKVKVFGAPPTCLTILASTAGRADTSLYTDTLYRGYPSQQWQQLSLPLGGYAGQQVSFAFVHTGYTYYDYGIELDSLAIDYDTVPEVSLTHSIVTVGDTTWFYATLNNCVSTGLFYLWHSTLTGQMGVSGSQWPVVYTSGGVDTVTLIVSNFYAADTVTMLVRVIDCRPKSIPFVEGFEGVPASGWNAAGQLPTCWDSLWNGGNAVFAPHVITAGSYNFISNTPDNALFMIAGNSNNYDTVALVTLPRMADSLQHLSLAFDYRFEDNTPQGTLQVGYLDGPSFVALQTMTPHAGSYRRDTVSLAAATVPDARIALRWSNNAVYYAVAIDNIEVFVDNNIPAPVVTVDSVGNTYAQLSWSAVAGATGYHVEVVGVVDTMLGIDTSHLSPLTFHLSALTPGTTYTVHVTALAGSLAGHTATVQFSTPCIVLHLPYSTDFSGVTVGSLPTCWTYQWVGSAEYAPQVVSGGYLQLLANFSDITGYVTQSYVTLPVVDDTLSHYALALQHQTSTPFTGYARVGYMRGSTFVSLANLPINSAATASTVFHDTVWLYEIPDDVSQLAICNVKTGGFESANVLNIYGLSIFLDTVIHAPTGLHADSVSAGCASLSWDSVRNVSSYHVVVDGTLDTVVVGTSITFCGLSGSTAYTVHVAAIGGNDTGSYAQTSFTTACGTITLPYIEDFESYTSVPPCWFYLGSGYDNFVNNWDGWGEYYHSGNHAMRLVVATFGNGRLFATPVVDAPSDSLLVSFWARYTAIYNDTLLAGVMTDPDDESSFIPLLRLYPTADYVRYTFDTRGINANHIRVAFRHKGQVSVATLMVDDIRIDRLRMRRVTLASNDSTMGTVSGGGTYVDSSQVSISATPFEGFRFTGWSDGDTNASRTLLLVSDTTLTAYFGTLAPDTVWRTVSVTASVAGVCETYGSGVYADSSTVEIGYQVLDTATAGGHWQFLGWSDGSAENPRDILVTSDTAIVALFQWIEDSVGIGKIENSKMIIDIYPNPTTGQLTIDADDVLSVDVFDMSGRQVRTVVKEDCYAMTTLNLGGLPAGSYLLKINTLRGLSVQRAILK